MSRSFFVLPVTLCAALLVFACTPALNWRELALGEGTLRALLPCKPDSATRVQQLAGQELAVTMTGCEAGGAMFAIASAEIAATGQIAAVQAHWQAQLLKTMQVRDSQVAPWTMRGATASLPMVHVTAQGQGQDGRPIQMQAVWFAREQRLYHAVIYAERITAEMSDPFLGAMELK